MTSLLNLSFGLLFTLSVGAPRIGKPPLEVGTQAPQFALEDIDGTTQDLHALTQKGPVVLVFFPKAKTPICSRQLQKLVERTQDIQAQGGVVLAISADSVATLKAFRDELKATFPFIADNKALLAMQYQARQLVLPMAARRTYVVDRQQNIAFVAEDDEATSLSGVVEALQALPKG